MFWIDHFSPPSHAHGLETFGKKPSLHELPILACNFSVSLAFASALPEKISDILSRAFRFQMLTRDCRTPCLTTRSRLSARHQWPQAPPSP